MLISETFKARLYQEVIAATASEKNTLCILPTGLGKTYVALLTAAVRLEKYPNSKMLMLAPTRPLVNQHMKVFMSNMTLEKDVFAALTGKVHVNDRKVFYEKAKIIFATPQTIRNDVNRGVLDLNNYSLLVVDECHRSMKKYAYTEVVEKYAATALNPRILGLTASPGGIKDKIEEVKKTLFIENIEIRTERDEDVQPYVKETEIERIYVELPKEMEVIRGGLKTAYKSRMGRLMYYKLIPHPNIPKRDLIALQNELGKRYSKTRNFAVVKALVTCAEAIKIEHAVGLLETQGITALNNYFNDMEKQKKSSATRNVLGDNNVVKAIKETRELFIKGEEHPKIAKLIEIILNELNEKPNLKIIVFANYRSSVEKIVNVLRERMVTAQEFIGQAKKGGKSLSQKRQVELLNEFKYEIFSVLVATSIGEEGLSIPAVNIVIFYEPVPSEIRTIQRRGRTGRTESGRVIFLITKGTRDEAYYWSAFNKEKKMKRILKAMQDENKGTLKEWVK